MSKKTSKSQRKRNRDYWNRKKRSKVQEKQASESERLTSSELIPQQGLRLPSAPKGKLYLMEADNGMLLDVPEEKLDDWAEMQGQGAVTKEQEEAEGRVLERVLEMLYGEAGKDK